MLGKPNKQKDFFDSYVYENLLPTEHILLDIKERIDFSFVEEETKDLYDNQLGRPSYPPEVLFKMLFLEFYYNLSDVEIAKQINYNILYRYFVGLKIHEPSPDDTSLVVFRGRLGQERFERLFNKIIEQAKEKNLLGGRLKIVDASKIVADVAVPNTVNLLRQGRKVIVKQIAKIDKPAAQSLEKAYVTDDKLYDKSTEEELNQELTRTREFIAKTKGNFTKQVDDKLAILEKITKGQSEDKVVSFLDLDARTGKTTPSKPFTGYKTHISEDESEIVTSVDTLKGNQNEGKELKNLLEKDQAKGIKHLATVGDAIYDTAQARREIKKRKMGGYIPSRINEKKLDNFIYDPKSDEVICKQGHASISKTRQDQGDLYIFSAGHCKACPDKANCPKPNNNRIRVYVSDVYKLRIGEDKQLRKEALIKRKMIERKFAEAKRWHGLSRARYRGKWRVAIQVLMTFLVMNAKRITRLLKEKLRLSSPRSILATEYG